MKVVNAMQKYVQNYISFVYGCILLLFHLPTYGGNGQVAEWLMLMGE